MRQAPASTGVGTKARAVHGATLHNALRRSAESSRAGPETRSSTRRHASVQADASSMNEPSRALTYTSASCAERQRCSAALSRTVDGRRPSDSVRIVHARGAHSCKHVCATPQGLTEAPSRTVDPALAHSLCTELIAACAMLQPTTRGKSDACVRASAEGGRSAPEPAGHAVTATHRDRDRGALDLLHRHAPSACAVGVRRRHSASEDTAA